MKASHPCRELILKDFDHEIFELLSNGPLSLDEIYNRHQFHNLGQLKSRIKKLKKHKYLKSDNKLLKIEKGPRLETL